MPKLSFSFDGAALQERMRNTARRASDTAARVQARLERGSTLKAVRFTGDIAVAVVTAVAQQQSRLQEAASQAVSQAGNQLGNSLNQAAQSGMMNGAATAAGIAALLNAHKYARGEIGLSQAVQSATREAVSGASSGMVATLAVSGSKIALGAIGAPVVVKAAAPVVAAAVTAWLATEATERGLALAGDWLIVPGHALPETPAAEPEPESKA